MRRKREREHGVHTVDRFRNDTRNLYGNDHGDVGNDHEYDDGNDIGGIERLSIGGSGCAKADSSV